MLLCHLLIKPPFWTGLDWNQLQLFFTDSAPRPSQYSSCNVNLSVCVLVCKKKFQFAIAAKRSEFLSFVIKFMISCVFKDFLFIRTAKLHDWFKSYNSFNNMTGDFFWIYIFLVPKKCTKVQKAGSFLVQKWVKKCIKVQKV